MSDWRRWATGVLAVFVVVGIGRGLFGVFGWIVFLVLALAVVVIGAIWLIRPLRGVLFVAGVLVIPLLALIGFNIIWSWIGCFSFGLLWGLVVGVVLFAGAGIVYLRLRESPAVSELIAIPLAIVLVVGAPLLWGIRHVDRHKVAARERPVRSQLDLLIVVPARLQKQQTSIQPASVPSTWDIHYSVARLVGGRLRWVLLDSDSPDAALSAAASPGQFLAGKPHLRPDADHAVVLDVDGAPPLISDPGILPDAPGSSGEIKRWLPIVRAAVPRTPKFALLETTDLRRLHSWSKALGKRGGAVSIQKFGNQALTDTALNAATTSSTASQDMTLALRFQPLLLFDGREPLDTPLDIDSLFASGNVGLCRQKVLSTPCPSVHRSSELLNGDTSLDIKIPKPRPREHDWPPVHPEDFIGGVPPGPTPAISSTIYVRPVRPRRDRGRVLFLDYWWYLPYNPGGTADGASCGAGLTIPGATCFDHQSDWEGVTVVVDLTGSEPVAVQYAQHTSVVRYRWDYLSSEWEKPKYDAAKHLVDDAADRPLVFVARGTHASYPTPCPRHCHQVANGNWEAPHRGDHPWVGNFSSVCTAATCVKPLPTRDRGHKPALWNAFTGFWGKRECILTYICDTEDAPVSPSQQDRDKWPWKFDGTVKTVNGKDRFVPAS